MRSREAHAAVEAQVTQYKAPAAMLSARGVASLAPVVSNDANAGRARHRRVEMVPQWNGRALTHARYTSHRSGVRALR